MIKKDTLSLDVLTQPIAGLFTGNPESPIQTPADKKRVKRYGYQYACLPIDRWLDCHNAGLVFIPANMQAYLDPLEKRYKYTHTEALWHGSDYTVVDLDNERMNPVLDPADFTFAEPHATDFLYAVVESVSSLQEGNSARWHGFVRFAKTVTTRQEYQAILLGLSAQLKYMTGADRQPAQPVYGNAREGCYTEIFESVLSESTMLALAEIGYQTLPSLRSQKIQEREKPYSHGYGGNARKVHADYDTVKDAKLRQFLIDYQVPIYVGARFETTKHTEIYYTPCPFASEHSTRNDGATDAFLTISTDDGKWGFGCYHEHCEKRCWKDFKAAITCPIRSALKAKRIRPSQVDFDDAGRIYRGLRCPICSSSASAVYLALEYRKVFVCEKCEPIPFEPYLKAVEGVQP